MAGGVERLLEGEEDGMGDERADGRERPWCREDSRRETEPSTNSLLDFACGQW